MSSLSSKCQSREQISGMMLSSPHIHWDHKQRSSERMRLASVREISSLASWSGRFSSADLKFDFTIHPTELELSPSDKIQSCREREPSRISIQIGMSIPMNSSREICAL